MRTVTAAMIVITAGSLAFAGEPVFVAKPRAFESLDECVDHYMRESGWADPYNKVELTYLDQVAAAESNVGKLSKASGDPGLRKVLAKHAGVTVFKPEVLKISMPVAVEAVAVEGQRYWAVLLVWEYNHLDAPARFSLSHVEVIILEARTGTLVRHRRCG